MEDHLFDALNVNPGGLVLDAGCGAAHVAIQFARKGLQIQGIDILPKHLRRAQKNVKASGIEDAISLRLMDYHHLDAFEDASFDGVYTLATFVHTTDPPQGLKEFFRVLKPGGRIALYEYDHVDFDDPKYKQYTFLRQMADETSHFGSMPLNEMVKQGDLKIMLEEAGFQDVEVKDLSANVMPMLRLFFILAYIPYLFVRLLGLTPWFVNTHSRVAAYRLVDQGLFRFIGVTGTKPATMSDGGPELRERKNLKASGSTD